VGIMPWPPPMRSVLPSPLDSYQLVRPLGRGAQGEVYLAEKEEASNSQRAIKFLRPRESAATLAAFLAEAELGLQVRSHYIGHTYEKIDLSQSWPDDWPRAALVMPYYSCSLADLLRWNQKFPVHQIVQWTRHLALALAHLHEGHVRAVHRDVKPGNIMFQLASQRSRLDSAGALLGATAILTDLGTMGALDQRSVCTVFRDNENGEEDPYKDPQFHPRMADGPIPEGQLCRREMDLYGFGQVLRAFAGLSDAPTPWLNAAADVCQGPPADRPRAGDLPARLSEDWRVQFGAIERLGGEWRPSRHSRFLGRDYIIKVEFEHFVSGCSDRGGVFVVMGPPGVGKSALLTKWAERTGRPFGYYFRYGGSHANPQEMPWAIAEQIKSRFGYDDPTPTTVQELRSYLETLCRRVAERPDRDRSERMILFVDALDEAANSLEAAEFIPKELPAGVFVVASSRPAAAQPGGQDHLGALRASGATIFAMRPDDDRNKDDVRAFLERELKNEPAELREQLGDHCGWLFLLVTLVVESLQGSTGRPSNGQRRLTLAEALDETRGWDTLDPSERLFEYYHASWQRLCEQLSVETLGHFACLMVAARSAVEGGLIGDVLRWHERKILRKRNPYWSQARVQAFLPALNWFLTTTALEAETATDSGQGVASRGEERRTGGQPIAYDIRHRSVRDYMTSVRGPVNPNGLAEMHQAFGTHFLKEAEHNQGWQHINPYGRFHAATHLLSADKRKWVEAGCRLLTNPDFLQATLGDEPHLAIETIER
jgi:hypothetical protein